MPRKLTVFIIIALVTYLLSNMNLTDITSNYQIDKSIVSFNKTYSSSYKDVSKAAQRAEMIRRLELVVKQHKVNGIANYYSVEKALEIIEKYCDDIKNYGIYYKVPPAVTMSVLFREIICLTWDDILLDNVKDSVIGNATIGMSQNGVQRAKDALEQITGNTYTNDQIKDMLNDEQESVFITVVYLDKIAKEQYIDFSKNRKKDIIHLFSRYNDNPAAKNDYGNQTYQYYQLFANYLNIIG